MTSNHLQAVQAHIDPSQPAGLYTTTVPSPDQPPSTSSLGTDTQQRTTSFELVLHCDAAIMLYYCVIGIEYVW